MHHAENKTGVGGRVQRAFKLTQKAVRGHVETIKCVLHSSSDTVVCYVLVASLHQLSLAPANLIFSQTDNVSGTLKMKRLSRCKQNLQKDVSPENTAPCWLLSVIHLTFCFWAHTIKCSFTMLVST